MAPSSSSHSSISPPPPTTTSHFTPVSIDIGVSLIFWSSSEFHLFIYFGCRFWREKKKTEMGLLVLPPLTLRTNLLRRTTTPHLSTILTKTASGTVKKARIYPVLHQLLAKRKRETTGRCPATSVVQTLERRSRWCLWITATGLITETARRPCPWPAQTAF